MAADSAPAGDEPSTGIDRDGLAPPDTSLPPWPGAMETYAGLRLHVRRTPGPPDQAPDEASAATPAVFVHGLGGSASNWTDLAGLLAPRMSGVALDLPGFGRSEPPPGGAYSMAASADVVTALLERTGPAHLFGNSMGGAVAITVAARRPELVRTLTLISPAVPDLRPNPRRVADARLPLAYVPVLGPVVRRRLEAESPLDRARALVQLCFAEPDLVPQNRLEQAVAEAQERGGQAWAAEALGRSFSALLSSWVTLPSRSLWADAQRITAPTLVIWGAQDKLVDVGRGPRLVARLARGRLLVLNRVGHVAQMERPVAVARAVVQMLEAVEHGEW